MRMLPTDVIPREAGNSGLKGVSVTAKLNFSLENGLRTCLIVFNMEDPS